MALIAKTPSQEYRFDSPSSASLILAVSMLLFMETELEKVEAGHDRPGSAAFDESTLSEFVFHSLLRSTAKIARYYFMSRTI